MVLPVGPSRGPLAVRVCCLLPLLVLPCCSMNVALVGVRRPARSLRTPPVPLGVQWLGAHVAR